jgi:N-acetylglucosaminyl-diphospho-decaprenol L-rhamnosyltransferase
VTAVAARPFHAIPDVSVLIVLADSGPSVSDCVRRVLDSEAGDALELIVLDNDSSDGVPQQIERAWQHDPRLRVVYNRANLGFGPAMNRGAAQARGKELLILNPDCLLDADTLPRLRAVLASSPRHGLVGGVVCDAQGQPDPASYRRDPLLRRALNSMSGRAANDDGRDARREGVNMPAPMPYETVPAEAVSGALMLVPRELFLRIGGFDEQYFLHCEDLDLCRRVRDAGYQVLLAGAVRVLHGKGGSSRHRPVFVSYHKHRGMWRWFRKFDPAARQPLTAALVWSGLWLHFALAVPRQWLRRARR